MKQKKNKVQNADGKSVSQPIAKPFVVRSPTKKEKIKFKFKELLCKHNEADEGEIFIKPRRSDNYNKNN